MIGTHYEVDGLAVSESEALERLSGRLLRIGRVTITVVPAMPPHATSDFRPPGYVEQRFEGQVDP